MPCGHGRSKMESTMLPRMYSNASTSNAWFVSKISRGSVTIVNRYNYWESNGVWQYNYDGQWNNLSSVTLESGVKLDSKSLIRFHQNKPDYGLRMLYYYEDASESEVGENVTPENEYDMKVAYMLIHPTPVRSNFTVHEVNKTYVLLEDQYWNEGISISDFVSIHTPVERASDPIPYEFYSMIAPKELRTFYENVKKFEMSRPVAMIRKINKNAGRLGLEVDANTGRRLISVDRGYIPLDYDHARLMFRPKHNFNGNLTFDFEVCDCLAVDGATSSKYFSINITVLPINDSPVYKSRTPLLPPIAYNLTDEPNDGFTVGELIKFTNTYDVENGQDIGIAIYSLPLSSKYGKWQYLADGNWEDLVVVNKINPFKVDLHTLSPNMSINAFFFGKDQRIRFYVDGGHLWKFSVAMRQTFLGFSYWDRSDGITEGIVKYFSLYTIHMTR